MAIASNDNNIILIISYYISLNEVSRLIYIYKIRKLSIFNNTKQFFSYRKNIVKMNSFKLIAIE